MKNRKNTVYSIDSDKIHCSNLEKEAKRRGYSNLKVICGDAHTLPFKKDFFDACFCNTVLEHVKDPIMLVKQIKKVLKKDGVMFISIPFLQEVHADPYDFQRYTPYGLKNILEKNGFKVIKQFCDYGALNSIEYLLLGSFVWRIRLGMKNNLPFGYLYIFILVNIFLLFKLLNILFFQLQKKDRHFMTQVSFVCIK